jgi:hypothetical protein
MERDEFTGQMLFPSDAVYKRHNIPRVEQLNLIDLSHTFGLSAWYEELTNLRIASDLKREGKFDNEFTLEDNIELDELVQRNPHCKKYKLLQQVLNIED